MAAVSELVEICFQFNEIKKEESSSSELYHKKKPRHMR
nr:MAG TPA: hypothetical protein [Caudoviricetes sp.]